MPAVSVRGLTKDYKAFRERRRALAGIDLDIESGETFGLLGPNGAGKTTFVKCLLGLLRPTSGTIEVLGRAPSDPETRRHIGFAPEAPRFGSFLSGPEVMRLHSRLAGVTANVREQQSEQLLKEEELEDAPKRTRAYSKGMIRRLALAQAMIGDPKLLILDEPTADLDPIGRRDVRVRLEAMKAKGVTIILNSHLLSEVERVCDRVAIIHQGGLIASGSVDELVPEGSDLETVFVDLVQKARGK